ncbi:hypothetical protein ATO67_13625 [Agrobacterium bohemicum]|uniref:Uncharacterized protein n=1 Tax=Agrobacterium bohemicum TaxID=2052828 RepID=A0A135NXZ8_9HYPH|nr:hypothetical protein ATO67_13625 [Agrobacterium bohemicum]
MIDPVAGWVLNKPISYMKRENFTGIPRSFSVGLHLPASSRIRFVGCEGNSRDIFRLAEAAERQTCNQLLAEFTRKIAIGGGRVRVTRQDGVHLDAPRFEFRGERECHRIDGIFGRGINAGGEVGVGAEDRADVDGAAAAFAKMLVSFPG